jgi:predicted NBD/HSP70 family sugar kinase
LQENNLAMEEHPLTAEDVFRRFRAGEDWVKPIVAETVDYLAQTVATLTVCYDPDIIILSGGVARSADLLIEPICERILATLPVRPKVVASQLGHKATILGTIIQTLYETTGIYVVRKLN